MLDSTTLVSELDGRAGEIEGPLRVLVVAAPHLDRERLAETLRARYPRSDLEIVAGEAAVLARLRREHAGAIVIDADGGLDAVALLEAARTAGCDDPAVIVSRNADSFLYQAVCRLHAEPFLGFGGLADPALAEAVARARVRHRLAFENHRLGAAEHRRLIREQTEADHLLDQQRGIVRALEQMAAGHTAVAIDKETRERTRTPPHQEPVGQTFLSAHPKGESHQPDASADLAPHLAELLRTYVIMGSGSLAGEIVALARRLSRAGVSPRRALQMHLEAVESLVRGLGNRSTRHVMARADLLALELMVHLAEEYRRAGGGGHDGPTA